KVALHVIFACWPLAVAAACVALFAYMRTVSRHTRAERQKRDAQLDRYIRASLTDEALRWAVVTWSKRYGR
ncbi:MAG TPA: hypothetical protein VMF89_33055, partial [Polyangiales bacterium]|nr:hypothetical protein [Polyangiales bacterium]